MKTSVLLILLSLYSFMPLAQNTENSKLPYRQIPDYPEKYNAGNVLSRCVDGLGYRFYWATEGLRTEDLAYKPSEESRSTQETILHIHGLSLMVLNASFGTPNERPQDFSKLTFDELREEALLNFQKASLELADKTEKQLKKLKVIFKNNATGKTSEFPLWNMMNGPLADALYHTGQIVVFRRISGNPMNPKVSVFMGKTGE